MKIRTVAILSFALSVTTAYGQRGAISSGASPTLCSNCQMIDQRAGAAGLPGVQSDSANDLAIQGAIAANKINGVANAVLYPGADIGAQVNAAVAAIGCGLVQVPAGTYKWTTPIVIPRCVLLEGSSGSGTFLNWAGVSTGAAIAVADRTGGLPAAYTQGGTRDITFETTITNPPIGLLIGGDPAGVITPSGASGDHTSFYRTRFTGFNPAVQFGNNAFANTFVTDSITNNVTGVYYPGPSLSNSGESETFIGTAIQNSTGTAIKIYGGFADFYFHGSHCDYNALCFDVQGNVQVSYSGHIEQAYGPVVSISNGTTFTTVALDHAQIVLTGSGGTDTEEINVAGAYANLFLDGGDIDVMHGVTSVIRWGANQAQPNQLEIDSPTINVSGSYGGLVNISPTWRGFTRIDQQFGLDTYSAYVSHLNTTQLTFGSAPSGAVRFTPSSDSNTRELSGNNAANTVTVWQIDANGNIKTAGNVAACNGANVIYRCPNSPHQVYWGSSPPSGCGTPIDTGLRAK